MPDETLQPTRLSAAGYLTGGVNLECPDCGSRFTVEGVTFEIANPQAELIRLDLRPADRSLDSILRGASNPRHRRAAPG